MSPALRCRQCGHEPPPESRFCNMCGTALAGVAPGVQSNDELPIGRLLGRGGRYRIERTIGKGGFGQAYLASDRQLDRFCVVKQLLINLAWAPATQQAALQNFRREAQLLVTLNTPGHPNIPEIYEYLAEDNCLVMKYIEGENLAQVLARHPGGLPQDQGLSYIRDVCSALAYMHSRTPEPVLHRDVKLSNILIDHSGRVWVIDFGLSKATPLQLGLVKSGATQVAGTIGYTAPEQWRGNAEPRSDVYALAATLHSLLTGYQPPFGPADLPDILRGKKGAFPPARQLNSTVSAVVERMIERGMAFKAADRPSAQEYLAALDMLLMPTSRQPIQTPDGQQVNDERELVAWCERNWDVAAGWLYDALPGQVERLWGKNRLAADLRALIARYASDQLVGLDEALALLDPEGFGVQRPRVTADRPTVDFGTLSTNERSRQVLMLVNAGRRAVRVQVETPPWAIPSAAAVALRPGQQARLQISADMRRVQIGGRMRGEMLLRERSGTTFRIALQAAVSGWKTFWSRTLGSAVATDWESVRPRVVRSLARHGGSVSALAFSPDGQRLASGSWDTTVRLWRVENGALIASLTGHSNNVLSVAFSPDRLILASSSADETIRLWHAEKGSLLRTIIGGVGYLDSVCFSPDGQLLAAASGDRTVRIWRVRDGTLVQTLDGHRSGVLCCDLSRDGQTLASGSADATVRIWQLSDGQQLHQLKTHTQAINSVVFSPDGITLASGAADGLAVIWDPEEGTVLHRMAGPAHAISSVAFHPDGTLLATGSADATVRLWRVRDGTLVQTLSGHPASVVRVCFSPDGSLLAAGGGDGSITLWGAGA